MEKLVRAHRLGRSTAGRSRTEARDGERKRPATLAGNTCTDLYTSGKPRKARPETRRRRDLERPGSRRRKGNYYSTLGEEG